MSHLFVWAASDLPVHLLAVVGAFALGGLLGGWAVGLVVKFAFNQKLPPWIAWTMRLLSGLVAGWLVWMWLFGPGGGGGGGGGLWPGGSGTGTSGEKDKGTDKTGKPDKSPDPITPKPKDPTEKIEPVGPGIGSGESIVVEVLGNGPLEKLARGGKMDPERRYRVADAPMRLRTFAEVKKLILDRRSQTPPLRKLDVVIYLDSPDQNSPPVRGLVEWARDLDTAVAGPLEVEEKVPPRSAPLK
jgi:hypothetical protein